MPQGQNTSIVALTLVAAISLLFLALQYLLCWTNLSPRIKCRGHYGCVQYRHRDVLFGTDYEKDFREAKRGGHLGAWMRRNHDRYGKTFEVKTSNLKRLFQTCNPLLAKFILSTEFSAFGIAPSRTEGRRWLGDGVVTADGETWKRSRDLLKPIFLKAQISDLGRLDKHLSHLMERLARRNYDADLQPLFLKMYLEYSMDVLFGDNIYESEQDRQSPRRDADAFIKAYDDSLLQVTRARFSWPVRWFYGWTKTWDQPYQVSYDYVEQHVDRALRDPQEPPAFVDHFIRETGSADRMYLRSQMLNVFTSARDATGLALGFVFFHLARQPRVYEKVRSEVKADAGDNLTYDVVKNLKYTNAVIDEALRLQAMTDIIRRTALADVVLPHGGGVDGDQPLFVPKGSIIDINISAIHRSTETWGADADAFRPERWLEDSTLEQRRAWQYLPFSGGPRICPAQAMVLAQMAYVLARFALKFREVCNRDPESSLA